MKEYSINTSKINMKNPYTIYYMESEISLKNN